VNEILISGFRNKVLLKRADTMMINKNTPPPQRNPRLALPY